MLTLKDIMTTDIAEATPDMNLREAMEMLSVRHISGAPVLQGEKVVGVFSSSDLLFFIAELDGARPSVSFRNRTSPLEEVTVADVMTRDVKSLAPDCSVETAALFMGRAGIHRVLVMDGERLVGIVTTTDLARAVAEHGILSGPYSLA